ncbi:hypothetical protein CAC42_4639 [Sphaceloma murrayae]|uniref:Uncharacterized protein n=1 Tax=Sphaceloma murrayae TaxID=2082308 RepID=A0A2K1QNH7_9PEZI|nr:hypothetical protein CAC42_4639 [Sphaceloma murrayae]
MSPQSPATSQILSDRLMARRMESKRARRRTDFGPRRDADDDDIFMAEAKASGVREPSVRDDISRRHVDNEDQLRDQRARGAATRALGMKEMDEKLQKLEKQNFDLKMEVFYRREHEDRLRDRLSKMHDQVELARRIQEEHRTLLELNKDLARDLEKSNDAVDQAVQMICDLEAQVEILQAKSRIPSSHSDSGYGGSLAPAATAVHPRPVAKQYLSGSSPVRNMDNLGDRHIVPRSRVPSFMSDTGNGTLALREAYASTGKNLRQAMSFVSILSDSTTRDVEKVDDLGSPRLSALSESSFPSIYDLKKPITDSADAEDENDVPPTEETPRANCREDSISRVSHWIERDRNLTPVRQLDFAAERHFNGPVMYGGDSTDESRRTSTTSTEFDSGFVGFPDGGSIITGTPSRFRENEESPKSQAKGHGRLPVQAPDYHRRKSSAEVYLHSKSVNSPVRLSYHRRKSSAETQLHRRSPSRQRQASPIVEHGEHWPLDHRPRQDSCHVERSGTPTKSTGVCRKGSTRASLAAKTQRLWGRLSTTGTRDSTSPPPKPRMDGRDPLVKSSTIAGFSQNNAAGDAEGHMSLGLVGMHYANPTKASTRRRSAETARRRQKAPEMSRNGAQAAWEGRGEGDKRGNREWRA